MKFLSVIALHTVLFTSVVKAAPLVVPKNVLISVGDLKENKSKLWKKETCLQVYNIANQIVDNGVNVVCREFDTNSFADGQLKSLLKNQDYHLRILRSSSGKISADATNLKRTIDSDFTNVGWNFQDAEGGKVSKEAAFAKVLGNFFLYVNNDLGYKAALLAHGAFESSEISYDQKNKVFRDRITNQPITIERALKLYESEGPRKKNYLRMGIEIGLNFSVGVAGYYTTIAENKLDHDYSFTQGLKGKLFTGEAIKFDDNSKDLNYGHTYAGVMYYGAARTNGFNSLESALITFASSAMWEFIEYREVFSINDQILTAGGGYIIGEASYQISCALLSKDSMAAKALGYATNPYMAANHALDKVFLGDKYASQPDCAKPRWSDISVYVGLERGQKAYEPSANTDYLVGLQAKVVNIEDYDKEGQSSKLVYDTAMADALIEANSNDGLLDLKVVAKVVMAAYHQKNLTVDEKGQLRGYDILLGVGSASTWHDRGSKELSPNEDFYGTVNILGATAHANLHYKGFNIKADFGIYGDFAMVKAYSLEPLKNSRGGSLEGESSIIKNKGYYWGMGGSALASISISKGRWQVGYSGQHSGAVSINERNRYEGTNGDVFKDTYHYNKFYINFSLTKNLKLQVSQEYDVRTGSVNNDFHTRGVETRTMGTLIYQF